MKISVNRLCKLAGIQNSGTSRGNLSEGSNRSFHEESYYQDEVDFRYGKGQLAEDIGGEGEITDGHCLSEEEMAEMNDDELMMGMPGLSEVEEAEDIDEDEVLEIDERELVQELRRAKRLMRESSRRRQRQVTRKNSIDTMIEQEVAKMMEDYSASASWVYGENKPKRSRDGYVTRSFPGIGFGKKY